MFLDHLNSGMFDRFTNENLENWLDFVLVIEKIRVSVVYLSSFDLTLWVRNEYGVRGSIDVVVWLKIVFINHVLVVT